MWSSRFRGRTEYGEKEGFAAEPAAIDAVRGIPGAATDSISQKIPFYLLRFRRLSTTLC